MAEDPQPQRQYKKEWALKIPRSALTPEALKTIDTIVKYPDDGIPIKMHIEKWETTSRGGTDITLKLDLPRGTNMLHIGNLAAEMIHTLKSYLPQDEERQKVLSEQKPQNFNRATFATQWSIADSREIIAGVDAAVKQLDPKATSERAQFPSPASERVQPPSRKIKALAPTTFEEEIKHEMEMVRLLIGDEIKDLSDENLEYILKHGAEARMRYDRKQRGPDRTS